MRWLTIVLLRLRSLLRRNQVERELRDEIQFHLDLQIEEHRAAGMAPDEARRSALREMGGVAQIQEECRDARGVGLLDSLFLDLRYALRGLIKNKAFTAVAVISLALGIGANTTIFSVIDAVMLRSLPVAEPDKLVVFGTHYGDVDRSVPYLPYPFYREMREAVRGVSGMFIASRLDAWEVSYTRDRDPLSRERALGVAVSGEYFETLGLRPQIGRLLRPEDDQFPEGHPVAVISDDLWRVRFDRDPGVVGETFRLNDTMFTIVGVAPHGFFGVAVGSKPDLWAPIQMQQTLRPAPLRVFARLEAGVSPAQVQASLAPAFEQERKRRVQRAPNEDIRRRFQSQELVVQPGGRGVEALRQQFSQPLLVLTGIVGLVLLIACANVANLLLARSIERSKEMAVRVSLGAPRGRLIRQLLTESLLLSFIGGAAGLALAYPASRLLVTLSANEVLQLGWSVYPSAIDVSPDLRVLLFTLTASTLAGILFGLAPAAGATRADLTSPLKKQTRSIAGGLWGVRWGRVLVVCQTALSVVLLIAAALFIRSLVNLYSLDAGYDRRNVLVARIAMNGIGLDFQRQPGQTRYPEAEAKIHAFYRRMLDGLRSVPGVESASISLTAVANSMRVLGFGLKAAGYTPSEGEDRPMIHIDAVGTDYFRTVGMNLLLGRDFTDRDSGEAPAVAILNDVAAKKYFGTDNPIGRQVWFNPDEPIEVVGVVRSARYIDLREEPFALMYRPALQGAGSVNFAVVRTRGAPEAMALAIRRRLAEVVPELRVPTITTLQRNVEDRTVNDRLVAQLSTFFGALALALAGIGLYGVLGSAVSRRTQEFGVRAALGARGTDLVGMILREGFALVAVGLLVGTAAALAAGRFVESLLFDLRANDPAAFIAAALLILFAAALGCLRPAMRAASVEPMGALRHE